MRVIHLVANQVFPAPGGLERSAIDVADIIGELPSTCVIIYSLHSCHLRDRPEDTSSRHCVIHLATKTEYLQEPFAKKGLPHREKFRLDVLALRSAVEDAQAKFAKAQHLLVSFFASTVGFVTQKVADDLGLPHVASIRGSDFSVGAYAPSIGYALQYVCHRATAIVTTNNSQLREIQRMYSRDARMCTIYNSVTVSPKSVQIPRLPVIFSDAGLSYKKGAHVLLRAFRIVATEYPQVRLIIAGSFGDEGSEYWVGALQEVASSTSNRVTFLGHLTESELMANLERCAVYASATLSEGCSNSRLKAISLLMPIATTLTGEVQDRGDLPHLFTSRPGDITDFARALRDALNWHLSGEVCQHDLVRDWLEPMHPRLVRDAWERVIDANIPKVSPRVVSAQPRLLFFSHDGTGVGHLRRLSRIARELQGPCACLVVTGHSTAGWIVPRECEFVHLPSLDSLVVSRAKYWGRAPFLRMPSDEARLFRNKLLSQVISWYEPDAIIVDFLPLGKNRELADAIFSRNIRKYFILRGVLDDPKNVRIDVLHGDGEEVLKEHYDRVFVTCDARVIDVAREYSLSECISRKLEYTGYVAPESTEDSRAATRLRRGIPLGMPWVVCSAGGGKLGERLIEECLKIASCKLGMYFDIVIGPRSALVLEPPSWSAMLPRVRVWQENSDLPDMHAACDIVICPGGYNSLVEAISGESEIICVPVQLDADDEQFIHARRLEKWYRLHIVSSSQDLGEALDRAAGFLGSSPVRNGDKLCLSGAISVRDTVLNDFGISNCM